MGSGTTGVVAKRTDRDFIGIELDEEYFRIAQERIQGRDDETKGNRLICRVGGLSLGFENRALR